MTTIDFQLVKQAVGGPLFHSKSIPFIITSNSLRIVYVNEAYCNFTGYKKEELIGKSVSIMLGKSLMALAYSELVYFLKHRKNRKNDWLILSKSGETLATKVETTPVKIDGKNYTLSITLDYTAVQRNKGIAEATLEKYHSLTENLPHIIWSNDVHGRPVYMNKVALKYFGKSFADFSNWDWLAYLDIEDARLLETEWSVASELQNPVQKIVRLKNASGRYKWFQIILYPQLSDQANTTTWTAIATDIDDRINAEQKLEKANKRLRSLIDASPIPIYSLDTAGNVKDFWNPAAERILGWKKEEVLGKRTPLASPEYFDQFEQNLTHIMQEGELRKIVNRKVKNGNVLTLEVNSGCIYDQNNDIEEIIILLLDITQQEAQKVRLQESLAVKRTLLQEIHHRVKNNLAIVVSLLQLQVYQSENEVDKNKLLDAQNRIMSIAMVHELLYSSEEFSKVNLKAYYEQLIRTIKANMTIHTEVHHKLEITLENLNLNQAIPLGLLINELITNSLKYAFTPKKETQNQILLSIHPNNESVVVTYQDNGVGFDMNDETFKTGLGFKIIESLLNQLDAIFEMESEHGFTLRFTFKNLHEEMQTSDSINQI